MQSASKKIRIKNSSEVKINIEKANLFLNTFIAISLITPIVFLFYMYLQSINLGVHISEVISSNPMVTISLIIAMISPFTGFIVKLSVDDIKENKNTHLSQLLIYIMAISQIIVGNIIGCIFLAIGIFKMQNRPKLNVIKSELENELKFKGAMIKLIGSIGILSISLLTSIFMYRLYII